MRLLICCLFCFSSFPVFSKEKPIIILDAGHGGKDQGARVRELLEKRLTLRTSYLTKRHLELLGYRVIMTRARDVFLPLPTRVTIANRRPKALFVSIHYNSASIPSAKGVEIYYFQRGKNLRKLASKKLAISILKNVLRETKTRSRGVKHGNFQVIRETTMPAVLVEAGFMTNAEERALLSTQVYLDKLAKGIAQGIDNYVQ